MSQRHGNRGPKEGERSCPLELWKPAWSARHPSVFSRSGRGRRSSDSRKVVRCLRTLPRSILQVRRLALERADGCRTGNRTWNRLRRARLAPPRSEKPESGGVASSITLTHHAHTIFDLNDLLVFETPTSPPIGGYEQMRCQSKLSSSTWFAFKSRLLESPGFHPTPVTR